MERGAGVRLLSVLLLAALNVAVAENKISYFVVGGKLELRPSPGDTPITDILWKHKTNLVALWTQGGDLTYFGTFKGRTTLDVTSGRLDIGDMSEADTGEYTVEINNKPQSPLYDAKAIEEVPKPVVWIQPLTCNSGLDSCTAVCDGNTARAEPATFSWRMGKEEWKVSTREFVFLKDETRGVETFTCQMENPVSRKESAPTDNPFYKADYTGIAVGLGVGVPLVLILGLAVFFRDKIKNRVFNVQSDNAPGSGAGNGQPASETSALNLDHESDPSADLKTNPSTDLKTNPSADLKTNPSADLKTDSV
ncbi:lymphocyte function-associated antigen 3-like [Pempheris klunzingeri]|uniref:lymphocyte function-associated antigen 3-like n=1 Tax=Pempheris klunzingeri TaxID=3127111 RepID=UPI00397FDBDF